MASTQLPPIKAEDITFHSESDTPLKAEGITFHPEEESSTLSDLATGTAQGLTFGFSDEALAALKAAYEVATTEKTIKDLPALYRQLQQVEQQKVSEAKERSPYAFTAAEFAGGLAPALFTGGAGAAAAAAKTGAKIAPSAIKSILGAAKAGAGYGALAAMGTTEKPIEETKDFIGEVGRGALAGATFGGVLGGAGVAAKKGLAAAKETELGRQMLTQFEEMKKPGSVLLGTEGKTVQSVRESEVAHELGSEFLKGRQNLGEEIGRVLKKAESVPIEVADDDVVKVLAQLEKDPASFKNQRTLVTDFFGRLAQGEALTPEEANNFRKILEEAAASKRQEVGGAKTAGTLEELADKIHDLLKRDVKGFEKASQDYHLYTASTIETLLGKGDYAKNIPVSKEAGAPSIRSTGRFFSDIADGATKLQAEIKDLVQRLNMPGMASRDKIAAIAQLEKNLSVLGENRPDLLRAANINPEQLISKLKYEADVAAGASGRFGYEPQAGLLKSWLGVITPRGGGLTGAALAGKAAGAIERSTPVKLAQRVYSAAEPELRKVADVLSSNPVTKHFGQNLASSLDKPKGISHRAILFNIMQSPEARKILTSMYPNMEE